MGKTWKRRDEQTGRLKYAMPEARRTECAGCGIIASCTDTCGAYLCYVCRAEVRDTVARPVR